MKLIIPAALVTASSVFALSMMAETQTVDTGAFTEIKTEGAIDVVFETAANRSVVIDQEEGNFSDIEIETDGDQLVIYRKSLKGKMGWNRNLSVNMRDGEKVIKVNGKRVPTYTVRITAPELEYAGASNSSTFTASGLTGDKLKAKASSSADMVLSGNVERLTLNASSSADIDAGNLSAGSLDADASSSADIEAVTRGGAVLEASSSADISVVSTGVGDFSVQASSSADVDLEGGCSDLEVNASSSGDVNAGDLICATAKLNASSGGDITAHATQDLRARASSGADINVMGNPTALDLKDSSGGDINLR